jgi:hypothetical protein
MSAVQWLTLDHLRTGTDPVSETLCSLEYRTMDNVQKPSNSEFVSGRTKVTLIDSISCQMRINTNFV